MRWNVNPCFPSLELFLLVIDGKKKKRDIQLLDSFCFSFGFLVYNRSYLNASFHIINFSLKTISLVFSAVPIARAIVTLRQRVILITTSINRLIDAMSHLPKKFASLAKLNNWCS